VHRAEVAESSEKTFRSQILIDSIAEAEEVKVSQDELTQYLIQSAAQYGMEPGEFIKVLDENGQIPAMIGEVARGKTLALILEKANIVDSKGKKVDPTPFIGNPSEDDEFDTSGAADMLASANAGGGHEGHDHGSASGTDSHGRKSSNEHYGHDHS
jgi:trigger factor